MEKPYSLKDLSHKVDWEGGIFEAIKYGITSEDIEDPKVKVLWKKLENISDIVEELEIILDPENFLHD